MVKARSAWQILFSGCCAFAAMVTFAAAESDSGKLSPSNDDLAFLLGDWSVHRVYQPGTEFERAMDGSLECDQAVSDQFIKCRFQFDRPDGAPIHDIVYFNYNGIYGVYESLWLSATWPIKVLMNAKPIETNENFVWRADFLIQDEVREWVRSEWTRCDDGGFSRRTEIRTSRDPEGQWLHWMDERAIAVTQNAPDQTVQNCK